MSFFINAIKKLNPNEDLLNNAVNSSFCGKFYNAVTRLISFIKIRLNLNSVFIQNIDNFYLVFLTLLIFALPYASTSLLGVLCSILIIISIIKSLFGHTKFKFSAIHIPIFVYLAIMLLSVGFSSLFMPSLKGFAKMVIYIGAFFSFFEFLKRNPRRIFPVIVMVAISSCIEMLFGLKQMIFGVEELAGWQDTTFLNPEQTMSRVFGTFLNPNLFAAYLISTIHFLFIISFYALIRRKTKLACIFGIFSLLSLIIIVQTGCRGAYIGLFVSIFFALCVFLQKFKKHIMVNKKFTRYLVTGGIILLIVGILFAIMTPAISHRLTSIFTLRGDSSNSYRMNVYISSLKMFFDNWLLGIGTGNTTFRLIYGMYMVTGFDALGAYNIYLEMAVESGIFLLLTFLWMMILTFHRGLKKIKNLPIKLKLVIIAVLSSLVAMLIHGFFDTVWYRPPLQILFWLYLAIIAVLSMKGFIYGKR